MCRLLHHYSVLLLVLFAKVIIGIADGQKANEPDLNGDKKAAVPSSRVRTKPMPIQDLHETKINDFPAVSYPMNILDMTKSYSYDPTATDHFPSKEEFDRSVQPEKLTANLRKKLKNFNSPATSIIDNIGTITSNKGLTPIDKSKLNTPANTAFSGKYAPTMGTYDKPNYYNSRQWARKLATLSKGSRLSPSFTKALTCGHGGQKAQNSTSVCTSLWSKDIPVIQVIDNAITMVEKMMNSSMLFNAEQHPSLSIKEATKIISAIENIQEILKIVDCLNGIESTLFYNVKTGVSNKLNESEPTTLTSEDKNISTPEAVELAKDEIKNEENTTVTVIQIVDHAITIVEDLLNSTVLQNIEKNATSQNVVLLTADEAEEMVNVVETIKDILGILEDLNGNVNLSVMKVKSNQTQIEDQSPKKRTTLLPVPDLSNNEATVDRSILVRP